jgi:hypothetical protein
MVCGKLTIEGTVMTGNCTKTIKPTDAMEIA